MLTRTRQLTSALAAMLFCACTTSAQDLERSDRDRGLERNPDVLKASKLIGTEVECSTAQGQQEKNGEVTDLVIDMRNNELVYALVRAEDVQTPGEGKGEMFLAVPPRAMRYDTRTEHLVVMADPQEFRHVSGFDENNLPERGMVRWSTDRSRQGVETDDIATLTMGSNIQKASELMGTKVKGWGGDDLGELEDLVVDLGSGRVRYAVLASGGFLGLGEDLFAVSLDRFRRDQQRDALVLAADEEDFTEARSFDEDAWPLTAQSTTGSSQDRFGEARHDERYGDDRYGRTYDDQGYGDDRYGQTRYGDDRYGRTYDDQGYGDDRYGQTRYGDDRYGRTYDDQRYGDERYAQSRYGDDRYGQMYGDQRYGDDRYGQMYGDQRHGDDRYGQTRYDDRYGRTYDDQRYGDDRYGQMYGEQRHGDDRYAQSRYGDDRYDGDRYGYGDRERLDQYTYSDRYDDRYGDRYGTQRDSATQQPSGRRADEYGWEGWQEDQQWQQDRRWQDQQRWDDQQWQDQQPWSEQPRWDQDSDDRYDRDMRGGADLWHSMTIWRIEAQDQSTFADRFEPRNQTTKRGRIENVRSESASGVSGNVADATTSIRFDLDTKEGEPLHVYIGPATILEQQGLSISQGDTIEVTGTETRINGRKTLIAGKITKDGKTVAIRDEQGNLLRRPGESMSQRGASGEGGMASQSLHGTVQRVVKDGKGADGRGVMQIELETSEQGTITVELGPSQFVDQRGFDFTKGDRVEVTGPRTRVDGESRVVAWRVTKGNDTLLLRDSSGAPFWSSTSSSR